MLSTQNIDVAISHYSDWSWTQWTTAWSFLSIGVFLSGVAVVACTAWVEGRDGIPHALVLGIAAAIGSIGVTATALWHVARHIEQYRWVISLGFALVAAVALTAWVAISKLKDIFGISLSSGSRWTVGVPAGVAAVIALGVLIGDGVHRAAAAVPMTVGLFVVGLIGIAAWTWSSTSRSVN